MGNWHLLVHDKHPAEFKRILKPGEEIKTLYYGEV
jgi:hypothetical protein